MHRLAKPELIFIATGSEVELAVAAWDKLTAEGVKARVVSMPSTDAFDKQDAAYRESVLPKAVTGARCRGTRVSLTTGSNTLA
ncbi:transketolase [Klebsiella pneumoniae]|uniref:Transketolase n=1 Tax=Klebsiella pneumoniae TaxID=573 RepID=A0A2X3F7Z8_KLEPN|nr:transketolase [Klebsiella pneumoniae]